MKLNGCHNLEPSSYTYPAQDGWIYSEDGTTRTPRVVQIKNVMSRHCVYSIETNDPRCAGCKHNLHSQCTGCQYEIEHEGKKVCRTMTRTHGQKCDAYRERNQ